MEYAFTLKYQLPDDDSVDEVVGRLGAIGRDDIGCSLLIPRDAIALRIVDPSLQGF